MKKISFLSRLTALTLASVAAAQVNAADFCYPSSQNYCDWSFCDGKVTIGGDWLFWKAEEDGLNVGSADTATPNAGAPTDTYQNYLNPKFQYENGYRVYLGYELPADCWDVNIAYSYLPTNARTSSFVTTDTRTSYFTLNEDAFPIFSQFDTDGTQQEFYSKWNATLNNVDVDLGKTVCFGECLKVRPHIGFRANWLNQKLSASMPVVIDADTSAVNTASLKESFTGYGVEGGLWGEWQVGCGFSVVGHVGGSILYSRFRIHETATSVLSEEVDDAVEVTTTTLRSSETIHSGTPTADYFVGLKYDDCFCEMLFSLVAGWEQHVLFDANRLSSDRGNLILQGLTLGMEIGF